ncbi:uncharacterized protein DS421_1g18380 [Arachis hypogaea]|nr:uncharacterized protein DS421_1g18380 [Arachis hypogaea]
MPKKATLASVRGRGIRLALPGPTKRSGSSTPTGSSTQQPSPITQEPTGSSTQITKNVVESSTQPSSSQTARQTKADYDFPIQTLLALQDAGLTKLHKKSWADICDSSDEDDIDLTKLISQMATQKTICNDPKGKTIAQTMPPQSNQTQHVKTQSKQPTTYISKNKFSSVLLMEPEFWEKSPFKVIPKVFPPGFHFRPTALNKTRQFYEFILVDSDSVSIKHYKDPKDATNITHSTIQILKYGKQEHPKAPPMLQRNAFVKWWSQFDAAMAHPEKVRNWFKEHPKFTKPFDHEESVFLNQKAQIAAALAGAQSKETLARHLQQIMQMIDEDKKHKDDPTPSEESSSDYNQNEDDCFGINLGED